MLTVFAFLSSLLLGRQQQQQLETQASPPLSLRPETAMHRPSDPFPFNPNARTEFLPHSCQTTAYPSSGGVVLGYFSAVEVAHLNLSRTHTTNRSSSPNDEDDLARRMLSLGAHWWPSWDLYARHQDRITSGIPYDFHFPPVVNVAFPSDTRGAGLWVFKFSADMQTFDAEDRRTPYLPRKPDDWDASIGMALTMDERSDVLERFGGRFYERVEDCADLAGTVKQGIVQGKRYEELLGRMDDPNYLDEWLDGSGRHC
ncbi:MAG: hypothetical protein Q9160_009124 [Pyrenula sp. 1 TL-2023]